MAVSLLGVALAVTATAPTSAGAAEVADLKEQLEDGLRARLPSEFKFIEDVVALVAQDVLPLSLVKGTFQWAQRKAGGRRFPFPYFENALRLRAKRIGVTIP
jgi:hypothetical protein